MEFKDKSSEERFMELTSQMASCRDEITKIIIDSDMSLEDKIIALCENAYTDIDQFLPGELEEITDFLTKQYCPNRMELIEITSLLECIKDEEDKYEEWLNDIFYYTVQNQVIGFKWDW